MSDIPPTRDSAPAVVMPQRRQVIRPGGDMRRRTGLVFLGLVLVGAAAFGFWFILQSVDDRQQYLVTTRTIERFEIVQSSDFVLVNANVGTASAMTPAFRSNLIGLWAVGTIPANTLVTPGMFGAPPLASEEDEDSVLIEVSLPAEEAAYGTLEAGDRVALIGTEAAELTTTRASLIGVLELETVQDGKLYYVVPPPEALTIETTVSRYENASNRRIWKLGQQVSKEDLEAALEEAASQVPAFDEDEFGGLLADDGAGAGLAPAEPEPLDAVPLEPSGEQ